MKKLVMGIAIVCLVVTTGLLSGCACCGTEGDKKEAAKEEAKPAAEAAKEAAKPAK
jgi:hypothetical protein